MLIVTSMEDKVVQVGVREVEAREKFKALMEMFTMYPTEIRVYNKTKTCRVEIHVKDNIFNVTVTNPEDEIFKL